MPRNRTEFVTAEEEHGADNDEVVLGLQDQL